MLEEITDRRQDLDWLRVIAFVLLIYFHAAVAFVPDGIPMTVNADSSEVLRRFVGFLHEFRLALLFMIAGVGVCFAERRRSAGAFLRERSRRLLVPLVFGVLVLVPPMVYLEKRFTGADPGSFLSFYRDLFSAGVYPDGNLSWHHFWFVAYLWLFCLFSLPLLRWSRGAGAERFGRWLRGAAVGYRLWGFALVLLLVELPLRPLFPGFRDLIHDWASFAQWWLVFLAGYAFARHAPLLERARVLRWPSLIVAVMASAILQSVFFSPSAGITPFPDGELSVAAYLNFSWVRILNLWCWLLALFGFAAEHLNRGGVLLRRLNDAVYPLFCAHLTWLVLFEYWLLPLPLSITLKYLLLTTGTLLAVWLTYEGVRRIQWLRPLFGLRLRADA